MVAHPYWLTYYSLWNFAWENANIGSFVLYAKSITKNDEEGESDLPTDDLSIPCSVEKLREKKKTQCKSSLRGPSLSVSMSVSLSFTCKPLSPGSLGKCQAMDWQRMKGCGQSSDGGGGLRQGRKNNVSEVFRHHICLTFLPISNKFSHSSWNIAPPFTSLLWQACAL